MTQHTDHLGPIEYAVIEFEGSEISDEVVGSLLGLVAAGTIRLMDVAIVAKASDGSVEILEIDTVETAGGLRELAQLVVDIVAEADIIAMSELLEPGTTALILLWENVWALDFAHAVRRSSGDFVAAGRIPATEFIAALDATIA